MTDADALILVTEKGILLRMRLADLREIGRATQGVRLIRLDEGDRVVAAAKIVNTTGEAEDENSGIADAQPEAAEPEAGEPPENPTGTAD